MGSVQQDNQKRKMMDFLLVLLFDLIITWSIGLSIPLAVRFLLLKRPLSKAKAIILVSCLLIFNVILFTVIKYASDPTGHDRLSFVYFIIAVVSYKLLRLPKKQENPETIKTQSVDKVELNSVPQKKKLIRNIVIIAGIILFVYLFVRILTNLSSSEEPQLNPTDKNPTYSEQKGDLYRNTKYKFRIQFPEGWEQKEGDGKHVVWKASKGNHSIVIAIRELPKELEGEEIDIEDLNLIEEIANTAKERWTNFKLNDSGITKINNKKSQWADYTTTSSTLDITVTIRNIQYYVINNNILYIITAGSSVDEFDSIENTFKKSITTFVFEDF